MWVLRSPWGTMGSQGGTPFRESWEARPSKLLVGAYAQTTVICPETCSQVFWVFPHLLDSSPPWATPEYERIQSLIKSLVPEPMRCQELNAAICRVYRSFSYTSSCGDISHIKSQFVTLGISATRPFPATQFTLHPTKITNVFCNRHT